MAWIRATRSLVVYMTEGIEIFNNIHSELTDLGFRIVGFDDSRPWGGFYLIDENQAHRFAKHFFNINDVDSLRIAGKLSPKILLVKPAKRLSWQFHNRRAEIWVCIKGTVAVTSSFSDEQEEMKVLFPGDTITLAQGERHRLIGLDEWGLVAEIWRHTDPNNPSDESDIVRLQDDFGR